MRVTSGQRSDEAWVLYGRLGMWSPAEKICHLKVEVGSGLINEVEKIWRTRFDGALERFRMPVITSISECDFEVPEERHDSPNKPMQKFIRGVDIITVIVQLFGNIKWRDHSCCQCPVISFREKPPWAYPCHKRIRYMYSVKLDDQQNLPSSKTKDYPHGVRKAFIF